MATVELKNKKISAVISLLGAEIQSVTRIDDGFDYIWNDTTGKYWGRHAPVLFPIIGQINQNTYYFDGHKYGLTQHGFLRDQTFEIVSQSQDAVVLKSAANADTKAKFPFDYQVTISYRLDDSALKVEYNVENLDQKTMYYSLGLHPGFNTTGDFANYRLKFDPAVTELENQEVDPAPLLSGKTHMVKLTDGEYGLSHDKLDAGLIVFSAKGLKHVQLVSDEVKHAVELNLNDFPYFAIWSPEKKNADFVCVEPFNGLPDVYGDPEQLQDKKAVNTLAAGKTDVFGTEIKFS